MNQVTKEHARRLDEKDKLRSLRNEFYIHEGITYMDGNSLGLLSKRAEESTLEILESWKKYGVEGWRKGEHPWLHLSERLGSKMAPLVGAKKSEVVVTGSTTLNLHQILNTFYRPTESRYKIVSDNLNFPSDTYAIKSHLDARGLSQDTHLKVVESADGNYISEDDIVASFSEDVSIAVLPSTWYRSGQVLDMKRITKAAHKKGVLVAFDLSHSAGSIPHKLHAWDVDFAFWCTYRHLNGGPGSVGAVFVHENHFGEDPGLAGWFGSHEDSQFEFEQTMTAAGDVGAYQIGSPHILSLAPLLGSLSIFEEVGIEQIRKKSFELTSFMIDLVRQELAEFDFIIVNPQDEKMRGGHVFLEHEEAARICKALKDQGVITDFWQPTGIRIAPVALYTSFTDVWDTIQILKKVMNEKMYENYPSEQGVLA